MSVHVAVKIGVICDGFDLHFLDGSEDLDGSFKFSNHEGRQSLNQYTIEVDLCYHGPAEFKRAADVDSLQLSQYYI